MYGKSNKSLNDGKPCSINKGNINLIKYFITRENIKTLTIITGAFLANIAINKVIFLNICPPFKLLPLLYSKNLSSLGKPKIVMEALLNGPINKFTNPLKIDNCNFHIN